MPRMTNNSMASAPASALLSASMTSNRKPRRKKTAERSKPPVPVFPPSSSRDDFETEPPKRALFLEPPLRQAGSFVNRPDLFPLSQLYSTTRLQPQQALNKFRSHHTFGLLPSPTFSDSSENVRPGLYTDYRDGRTFPTDQDMIDAAQTLLLFSRSGTANIASNITTETRQPARGDQQSPLQFESSNTRNDKDHQPRYEIWKQGDARLHIVNSGLSPKARRIRDRNIGVAAAPEPLPHNEEGHLMKMYDDDTYFNNPVLKAINDSPPKRRQANNSSDMDVDSEDDITEVEDEVVDDVDMKDSDYNASSPHQPESSPFRPISMHRSRGRLRLSAPPKIVLIEDESDGDSEDDRGKFSKVDQSDRAEAELESSPVKGPASHRRPGWNRRMPQAVRRSEDSNSESNINTENADREPVIDSSPIKCHRRRNVTRQMPRPVSAAIQNSESDGPSENEEVGSPPRPPRPSTSPMSRIRSRAVSLEPEQDRGKTSWEPVSPASQNLRPVSTPSSLQRWLVEARSSQSHRASTSPTLKSFLQRSEQEFYKMKNQEADETDNEMQHDPLLTTPAAYTNRNRLKYDPVRDIDMPTPVSMEEGEIIDDGASDATTVVSPTKQRENRRTYQRVRELNYG